MKRIAICIAVSTSLTGAGALISGCDDPIADEPPPSTAEISGESETATETTNGDRNDPDAVDEEPTAAEAAAAVSGSGGEPVNAETRVADVDPEEARFGSIDLVPGFMPDPARLEGRAGGDIRARTWNPACNGWVTQTPNHVFVASLAFAELRVMAHAPGEEDLTLVLRKPDGTYVCNDDAGRRTTDPMVSTDFASGEYSIWVGAMRENETPAYMLGISELPNTAPNDLARND